MQLPSLDNGRSHLSRSGAIFAALLAFLVALVFYNLAFFNIINAGKAVDKFGSGRLVRVDAKSDQERAKAIELFNSVDKQIESILADRPKESRSRVVLMLIDALRFDFIFHRRDGSAEGSHERFRKPHDVLMPFVNRLFTQKQALPFKLTAKPPTVTLPRLKALVSGIVPDFIDVLWNFNTTSLYEDSIIRQMKKHGRKVTFFGDDTWLKLFDPDEYFVRYDGTTSFIASDYDEVDANVTRHLASELERTDWDMMVLHYLGLDHVGHIEGPFAPVNIRRKLSEMDDVIRKIYTNLTGNDMLVVLSDHGMANEGGHGGSSYMEVTTPVIFIKPDALDGGGAKLDPRDLLANISTYKQVDFVSTLSCLVDLPIPENNKGTTFVEDILSSPLFESQEPVVSLIKVFKCLNQNLIQLSHEMLPKDLDVFRIGSAINKRFMETFGKNRLRNDEAYHKELRELNKDLELLVRNSFKSDSNEHKNSKEQMYYLITTTGCMAISVIYLVTSYLGFGNLFIPMNVVHLSFCFVTTLVCQIVTYFKLIHDDDSAEWVYISDIISVKFIIMLVEFLLLSLQLTQLVYGYLVDSLVNLVIYCRHGSNNLQKFFLLGSVMYLLSLFSSSFIEEEHQIWYYLDITQLYLLFTLNSGTRKIAKLKNVLAIILILASTRLARSINQTGNKWIHLKDFGDTLREQESKFQLVFFAFVSLALIFVLKVRKQKQNHLSSIASLIVVLYDSFLLLVIFYYHLATNNELYTLYERNQIAQLCYLFMFVGLVFNLFLVLVKSDFANEIQDLIETSEDPLITCKHHIHLDKRVADYLGRLVRLKLAFETLATYWIYLMCLIQPSHNLLLLLFWQTKEHCLDKLIFSLNLMSVKDSFEPSPASKKRDQDEPDFYKLSLVDLFIFTTIISHAGHFTQGNSNSLNTIQVSSGMVGMNDTNRPLIGLLMASSTYASIVFWFFFLLKTMVSARLKHVIRQNLRTFSTGLRSQLTDGDSQVPRALLRVVHIKSIVLVLVTFLYTISSFIQRQHLFVWSVFAPKLIYQLFYFLIDFLQIAFLKLVANLIG